MKKLDFNNPASVAAAAAGDVRKSIVAATPGGIEQQEKAGQIGFVNSGTMPIDAPWPELEAMGFKRGEAIDELFCKAGLPHGWKKEASTHDMWSYILDETGKRRVAIFYKAAFYDRRAHAMIEKEP